MPKIVDSTDIRELGENILQKRMERHMTQQELGECIGISSNMIHLYESAQIIMKVDKLFLLVNALECTPNDLSPVRFVSNQVINEIPIESILRKMQKLNTENQVVVFNTLETMIDSLLEQQKNKRKNFF